eukprot:Opistho-2@8165
MVQASPQYFSDVSPPKSFKTDSRTLSRNSSASDMVATISQARTNRWVPPSVFRDCVASEELVFRKVRGILNRLTAEKFDSLCDQLINVGITNINVLRGIIVLLFEKALDEPSYSSLYAEVARRVSAVAPNFDDGTGNQGATFRTLLLNKCQEEFENRSNAFAAFNTHPGPLGEEDEEKRTVARRKMLGNIRFIGELGKLRLLSSKVIHECIKQLLQGKVQDAHPEDIECLCRLMRTVGKAIDTDEASSYMDAYFNRMNELIHSDKMPNRLKFALEDIVELRKNQWIARRVSMMESKPKKISEIHAEADMDHLVQAMQARGELSSPLAGSPGSNSPALNRNSSPRGSFLLQGRGSPAVGLGSNGFSSPVGGLVSNADPTNVMGTPPDIERLRRISSVTAVDGTSLRPHVFVPGGGAIASLPPSTRKQEGTSQPLPPPIEKPVLPPPIEKPKFQKGRKDSGGSKTPPTQQTLVPTPEAAPQPSADDLAKLTSAMLAEYLSEPDDGEAAQCVKDMRSPEYHPELIVRIFMEAVEKGEGDRLSLGKLASSLVVKGAVSRAGYIAGVVKTLDTKEDLAPDVPHIARYLAAFIARGVADGALPLEEALGLLKPRADVAFDEVVFEFLQALGDFEGSEKAAVDAKRCESLLLVCVAEAGGSKDRLLDLLVAKNLGQLFPVASLAPFVRATIAAADAQPAGVVKSIREKASNMPSVLSEFDFALVLADALIERITGDAQSSDDSNDASVTSPQTKSAKQKELQLMTKWMPVAKAFVAGRHVLQVAVLYAAQVSAHRKGFPTGLLERHFDALYNLDIVDEEAYNIWKEDVNDSLPGKQRALFQVNRWLNWLATAESESDDDE